MIRFAEEHDLEYDECYTAHRSHDDPDESIENQEHEQDYGCLEGRLRIDLIHLSKYIIADPHIDRSIIFERLIDEILLIGIELLDHLGIDRLFALQGDILPYDGDILHFRGEESAGICLDFFDTGSDWTGEERDCAARCIGEILAGEREFLVISEDEETVSDGDEDREHISSGIEVAHSIPFDLII